MPQPLETAKLYLKLSNKSDFSGIENLFTDSTKYSSKNTGTYLGSKNIIAMQREFHGKFSSLKWTVNSIKELEPGVIVFDYDFVGEKPNGEKVESSGLEYVTVQHGRIQSVEIRNK